MLGEKQIEELAKEIREFLLDNHLWVDVTIYFNNKAFSTYDGKNFYYNDPTNLIVLEDKDPRDYFDYVAEPHILSMAFEGDLYGCFNGYGEYGYEFDHRIQKEFQDILDKYGLYYEMGNRWNLTCYCKKGAEFMERVEILSDTIRIYDNDNNEVVGWVEDEWLEDPNLVLVIANAINIFYGFGTDRLKTIIHGNM